MSAALRNFLLLAAALGALLAGVVLSKSLRPPALEATPTAAIDFALPDLEGRERTLSEWRGQVILLNFWATWCPPCREEIPLLIRKHERYAGQGLAIIGIAIDRKQAVDDYRRDLDIPYPILMAEQEGLKLLASYGNRPGSLPYSVIIDRDGAIADRKLGIYRDTELEERLRPLLGLPAVTPPAH